MAEAAGWTDPQRTPLSTYRVQLRDGVDFATVAGWLDHLVDLGVSHLYLSPVLSAVPGSTHGYDVTDPTLVDPALGGEDGLVDLSQRANDRGIGLILDCVPNHVAALPATPAWTELLVTGPRGASARIFDVDWDAPHHGGVVLPVLDAPLDEVVADGRLRVERDDKGGWVLVHHEHRLPVADDIIHAVGTDPGAIVLAQRTESGWLPVHWRAHDLITHRRFFAVNELAAIRCEDPAVASWALGTVWRLVDQGVVDGLRLDHVDGLRDPQGVLDRTAATCPGAWVVVEKITAPDEGLVASWPVAGTSGYEALADIVHLSVDADAEEVLTDLARRAGAWPTDVAGAMRAAKVHALTDLLGADLDRIARVGWEEAHHAITEFGPRHLHAAIAAYAVSLDRYRTYVRPAGARGDAAPTADDRAVIDAGCSAAAEHLRPGPERAALAFLRDRLGAGGDLALRVAQLTGPVAAKGIEDTFAYRQHRLCALNEVGVEPAPFGLDVAAFHARSVERQGTHPLGMSTTSTHDTKRGEDVRMRIAALSHRVHAWEAAVRRWLAGHRALVVDAPGGPAPDDATRLLVYQTLVGVWPLDGSVPDADLRARLAGYLTKALREGAVRTTWHDPDAVYEAAVLRYADALASDAPEAEGFVGELRTLLAVVHPVAVALSLGQVVLRTTMPGVPDLYRGCEVWEDSLVDPDNRRPVDVHALSALLTDLDASSPDPAALLDAWPDGRIKLWTLSRTLRARRDHAACFGAGSAYVPLAVEGPAADAAVAFARVAPDGRAVLTVTTHRPTRVDDTGLGRGEGWHATTVTVPGGVAATWISVLDGRSHTGTTLDLADILADLPVAVLAPG